MGRLVGVRALLYPAVAVGLIGCASSAPSESELAFTRTMSPSIELATTEAETQALLRAGELPANQPIDLGGQAVLAGPVYAAASGRRCREITIGASHRLACQDLVSDSWVFVPDPFGTTWGAEATPDPVPSATSEGGDS